MVCLDLALTDDFPRCTPYGARALVFVTRGSIVRHLPSRDANCSIWHVNLDMVSTALGIMFELLVRGSKSPPSSFGRWVQCQRKCQQRSIVVHYCLAVC